MEYNKRKQKFVYDIQSYMNELNDIVSAIVPSEQSIKELSRFLNDFAEYADDSIYKDKVMQIEAERNKCVCVHWSDGIDTIVSGSAITQELKDHIQWRTETYAGKGEDLTFRIEIGDRRLIK